MVCMKKKQPIGHHATTARASASLTDVYLARRVGHLSYIQRANAALLRSRKNLRQRYHFKPAHVLQHAQHQSKMLTFIHEVFTQRCVHSKRQPMHACDGHWRLTPCAHQTGAARHPGSMIKQITPGQYELFYKVVPDRPTQVWCARGDSHAFGHVLRTQVCTMHVGAASLSLPL